MFIRQVTTTSGWLHVKMRGDLYSNFLVSFLHLYGVVHHVGVTWPRFLSCSLVPLWNASRDSLIWLGCLCLRDVTACYSPLFGWGVFVSDARFEGLQAWVSIYCCVPGSSCLGLFAKCVNFLVEWLYFSFQIVFTFTLVDSRMHWRHSSWPISSHMFGHWAHTMVKDPTSPLRPI